MHFQKFIQVAIIALAITSHQAIARNVTMVSVEWAPHYGSELPEKGLTTALVKAAFEALNIDSGRIISQAHGEAEGVNLEDNRDAFALARKVSVNFVEESAEQVAQN